MGTTALNGPVLDGLRSSNSGLIGDKRALQAEKRALEGEVATADELVQAKTDELIGGRLQGRRVLLVSGPGADGTTVDRIAQAVADAGGAVSGRLALQPALLEPGSGQLVEDLVAQVVPAGVDLPEGSALARAGAVLAGALLSEGGSGDVDRDAAQSVVSAFGEAGLAALSDAGDGAPQVASLAVLVAAPAPDEPTEQDRAVVDGLLDVATELDARSAGLVVAGPAESAVEGGLVRALRADSARDGLISSVDNADRAVGQVAVVLALREQSDGGVGRYGGAQGASAPAPTAAPDEDDPEG